MIVPRDYQSLSVDCVFTEWETHNSTLVVVPTGGGKTIIAAETIRRIQPKKTLFLAPARELVWQARDRIFDAVGLKADIEMADEYAVSNPIFHQPVIVSTVQSQIAGRGEKRRMHRFDPMQIGLVILDECHKSACKSYREILKHYKQNPNLKILGITATPDRSDGKALGEVFESVAFDYEINNAIDDGWLVPVDQQMITINHLDYSHVRTTAGDLNQGDLAAVMEQEEIMQGIAGALIETIGDKRTLVFTVSVDQARVGSNIMNRHKWDMAAWVCGATPEEERKELLADFKSGKTQVMWNCAVLGEGYDNPAVEIVAIAAPTKSRSRYAQRCGRSLRPLPNVVDGFRDGAWFRIEDKDERRAAIAASAKPRAIIIDFAGNSGRHKLMTTADILGGKYSEEEKELALRNIKESGATSRIMDELEKARMQLIDEEKKKKENEDRARKAKVLAKVSFSSRKVNPFDVFDIEAKKENAYWDSRNSLTENQTAFLRSQGIEPRDFPYTQAKQLLVECFRRKNEGQATFKQVKLLGSRGIDTKGMTFKQASEAITALSVKEHWKPKKSATPAPVAAATFEPTPVFNSTEEYADSMATAVAGNENYNYEPM